MPLTFDMFKVMLSSFGVLILKGNNSEIVCQRAKYVTEFYDVGDTYHI